MKKRLFFSLQIIALVLFGFTFLVFLLQLSGSSNPLSRFNHQDPVYNNIEAFDPSLSRLNSLKKLEQYCDSVYAQTALAGGHVEFEQIYTDIVSATVGDRFFHGYSHYGFNNNYIASIVSGVTIPGLSALVMPDDILKHPFAACSQQSIVMMELLKNKGFSTRKITFYGKRFGGHFAFEVSYGGSWHFHDPNLEPDKAVLNSYGRPGIDFLASNTDVLIKAYSRLSKEEILDIFPNYKYGPVNTFPAPKALEFQRVTRFLSNSIWLFFLIAFIFIRRKYLRLSRKAWAKNNLVPLLPLDAEVTSIYYPGYTAHGV